MEQAPSVCKLLTRAGLALAALLLPSLACAETHYKPQISIGVRGGASLAEMSMLPSPKQTMVAGGAGAVQFRYQEEKMFGLLAELGMSTRGWAEDFLGKPLQYRRTLTALTLPVMTQFNYGGRRMRGFVNLGPEVSYIISDRISSNFDYTNPEGTPDWPSTPRATAQLTARLSQRIDYGITAGLGAEYRLTPRNSVTLEARFYYGLANVFPSAPADPFNAARCMNLEVTAGWWFRMR